MYRNQADGHYGWLGQGWLGEGANVQEPGKYGGPVARVPKLVTFGAGGVHMRQCSASSAHTVCVTISGAVYAWGGGQQALGHAGYDAQTSPKRVVGGAFGPDGNDVRVMSCDAGGDQLTYTAFTVCVMDTGRVVSFVASKYGQLAQGVGAAAVAAIDPERLQVTTPRFVDGIGAVEAVSAGMRHTLFLSRGLPGMRAVPAPAPVPAPAAGGIRGGLYIMLRCEPGTYQDDRTATQSCKACPVGTNSNHTGMEKHLLLHIRTCFYAHVRA
jgi:hypothetical protein